MKRLAFPVLAFLLLLPATGFAKNAEIMLLPTRVVMENNDRSASILVKNSGDATGDFDIGLVDMKMDENGQILPYASGETPAYSALPYLQIAPHRVRLKAGESQNVRLLLHKPENLSAGDYRAHVKVRLVSDDIGAPKPAADAPESLVIIMPVIVRNGQTTLAMGIEGAKLTQGPAGHPAVALTLTRSGNRSAMGDISVTCTTAGMHQVIKFFPGVAVYRPTTRRLVSVPLDETPQRVDLAACKLEVAYTAQQKDGGQPLAQAVVSE